LILNSEHVHITKPCRSTLYALSVCIGSKKDRVKITQTRDGSHGDHWGALLGFDESIDLGACVDELIDDLKVQSSLRNINKLRAKYGNSSAIGVQVGDSLVTLFPALYSAKRLPVVIKEITEWEHVDGIEAELLGLGRETFAINFFATDYLENSKKYKKGGERQISLTGVAYVIDEASELPSEFSAEYCSYMPSSQTDSDCDYDFIGKILSIRNIKIKNHELCELEVKTHNVLTIKFLLAGFRHITTVTHNKTINCAPDGRRTC